MQRVRFLFLIVLFGTALPVHAGWADCAGHACEKVLAVMERLFSVDWNAGDINDEDDGTPLGGKTTLPEQHSMSPRSPGSPLPSPRKPQFLSQDRSQDPAQVNTLQDPSKAGTLSLVRQRTMHNNQVVS